MVVNHKIKYESLNDDVVSVLDSSDYKLIGVDLTKQDVLSDMLKSADFNTSLPTLVISEVSVAYMAHQR